MAFQIADPNATITLGGTAEIDLYDGAYTNATCILS